MTPSEYFDAAKNAMRIASDYELAKRLDVPNKSIPAMRKGTRYVPLDMAFKLAIALELDPSGVVADLECQREKNEKRREFWKGFLSRAAMVALMACTLAWSFSESFAVVAEALGGASLALFLWRRTTHNLRLWKMETIAS